MGDSKWNGDKLASRRYGPSRIPDDVVDLIVDGGFTVVTLDAERPQRRTKARKYRKALIICPKCTAFHGQPQFYMWDRVKTADMEHYRTQGRPCELHRRKRRNRT